jgi:D-alanyl-D-alanine carboxypeptidase/D-alanyl-D-alanine-endopeptidase (penicillin-binding protein 4)
MNEISLVILLLGLLSAPDSAARAEADIATARSRAAEAAVRTLHGDLEQILRRGRLINGAGLLVISLDHGDTLFVHHADSALAPASNLKLFTSVAALHYLGPTFRYNTYLLTTGPVKDAILEGDVILYGTGDPTLSDRFGQSVLNAFADTLVAHGVREIRGDVVGDASYFGSDMGVGIGWEANYSNALYAAPASALSLSENIAAVEIRPGSSAGERPQVRILPGGNGLELVNLATTTASGRSRLKLGRSGYTSPLTVSGSVSRRTGSVRYMVPVANPPLFAAGALREALNRIGITVHGETRAVHTPAQSALAGRSLFAPALAQGPAVRILAIHTSPPLLDVLEVVNKRSQNFLAEQVLRTLGRVVLGDGSIDGGKAAVELFARSVLHLADSELEVFDGSGLSPLNRTTPGALVDLLRYAAQAPVWEPFWHTLPQTGARDGLRRMINTRAEGRVWAKTGTIQNVSALSGYVRANNGELLAFSILNNQARSASRAKRVEDQIVARLAAFDRGAGEVIGSSGATAPAGAR